MLNLKVDTNFYTLQIGSTNFYTLQILLNNMDYLLTLHNTQKLYNDYDATLSEPCSDVSATPVFLRQTSISSICFDNIQFFNT